MVPEDVIDGKISETGAEPVTMPTENTTSHEPSGISGNRVSVLWRTGLLVDRLLGRFTGIR